MAKLKRDMTGIRNAARRTERTEIYELVDEDGQRVRSPFTLKTITTARKALRYDERGAVAIRDLRSGEIIR